MQTEKVISENNSILDEDYQAASAETELEGQEGKMPINGQMYSISHCEEHFQKHPLVNRCKLIRAGSMAYKLPALVIEPSEKILDETGFSLQLLKHAREDQETESIEIFYKCYNFPKTSNETILGQQLEQWANRQTHLAHPFC